MRQGRAARPNFVIALLGASVCTYTVMTGVLFPVLPVLQAELHTSLAGATWMLTAYLVAGAVATPILGRLGDSYGRKRMFAIALGLLALGSLAGAVATSLPVMICGRIVQGSGGGVLPLSFGIIEAELPRERVAGSIGLLSAMGGLGTGLGVVLAGPIVESLGYHWLFWIPLIPTVAIIVALRLVPGDPPVTSAPGLTWRGLPLLCLWLVALLLPVSEGGRWGWASPLTIGLLVVAAGALPWWVVAESRSPVPWVDMTVMRVRAVWTNNAVAFLTGACIYATLSTVAEFVQTSPAYGFGFGVSVTEAGVMILPMTVTIMLTGVVMGPLTAALGSRSVLSWGTLACTAALVFVALNHGDKWQIYAAMAIFGTGLGLVIAAQGNLIVRSVPSSQCGMATAMNANIRLIGGSVGATVTAAIIESTARAPLGGAPTESGYVWGLLALASFGAVGVVMTQLIPRETHLVELGVPVLAVEQLAP